MDGHFFVASKDVYDWWIWGVGERRLALLGCCKHWRCESCGGQWWAWCLQTWL